MNLRQTSTAMAKKHMFCGMLLLCISETTAQDQQSVSQAKRGDDCNTVASSMMQTHSVRSRADFHENAEAGADEEHYESKEANQVGFRNVKHGNFNIRVWADAITHEDGKFTWILTHKGDCNGSWMTQIEKCLPPTMIVKDKGHPDTGGLCLETLQGTEEDIKQYLSNCTELDGNTLDIETDSPVQLPNETDDEPDSLAETLSSNSPASWGLDRIDQRDMPRDSQYDPSPRNKRGEGVHVFVGDTGIRISHTDFGGRAFAGYDATPTGSGACKDPQDKTCAPDGHGHGTHCAGTVGGTKYGVANTAKLYAVKVLTDSGSGTRSGILLGIDWVKQQATTFSKKPAIISLSLGGSGKSQAWKDAIDDVTSAGLMVVVAAGNSNHNACGDSPAFVPSAITVGSTTDQDKRSSFSSWGPCVDIFAPGSHIKSAGIQNDNSEKSMSGTSMACPHVAGAYALLFSANPNLGRADIEVLLFAKSTKGKGFPMGGGPDNFLYVGSGTEPPTPVPTPSPPPPPVPAADCNFENSCIWFNLKGDQFDWTRKSGTTPSKDTGPSSAADGAHYMYIEASNPRQNGDTAILKSPPLILVGSKLKLEFKYHMYGKDVGSLAVTVDGVEKWSETGNQGNSWKTGTVTLENWHGEPEIAFEGTVGSSWSSDIAIDSVRFVHETGPSPTPVSPSPTMAPTVGSTAAPVSPTMSPTAAPAPTPVVVVGPAGPPGPPGPHGKTITNVGPPGPPGPPR